MHIALHQILNYFTHMLFHKIANDSIYLIELLGMEYSYIDDGCSESYSFIKYL